MSDIKYYTINGLKTEARKRGVNTTNQTVAKVMDGIPPEQGEDKWSYETYEAAREVWLNNKALVSQGEDHKDEELLDLIKEEKRQNIENKKLTNANKRGELVHRDEVFEFILSHFTDSTSILRSYLLSSIPNSIPDPSVRQKLLECHNDIMISLGESVKKWIARYDKPTN